MISKRLYWRGPYLAACLDSLLNSSYAHILVEEAVIYLFILENLLKKQLEIPRNEI
jgi:hypothetical protein